MPSVCLQHANGEHLYRPGKRQLVDAQGRRAHPTVKESWLRVLICICGEECPPSQRKRLERKRLTDRKHRVEPVPGTGVPSSHGTNPKAVKKRRAGERKTYRRE